MVFDRIDAAEFDLVDDSDMPVEAFVLVPREVETNAPSVRVFAECGGATYDLGAIYQNGWRGYCTVDAERVEWEPVTNGEGRTTSHTSRAVFADGVEVYRTQAAACRALAVARWNRYNS